MPLSDREQQLLEQMEQALSAEDPKFANSMRGDASSLRRSQLVIGIVGFLVGLGVVLLGVTMSSIWVGVVGFVVMLAAVVFAVTPRKTPTALGTVAADGTIQPAQTGGKQSKSKPAKGQRALMQRLEERWDRRRDQQW